MHAHTHTTFNLYSYYKIVPTYLVLTNSWPWPLNLTTQHMPSPKLNSIYTFTVNLNFNPKMTFHQSLNLVSVFHDTKQSQVFSLKSRVEPQVKIMKVLKLEILCLKRLIWSNIQFNFQGIILKSNILLKGIFNWKDNQQVHLKLIRRKGMLMLQLRVNCKPVQQQNDLGLPTHKRHRVIENILTISVWN